jgi:hypothetical protein
MDQFIQPFLAGLVDASRWFVQEKNGRIAKECKRH